MGRLSNTADVPQAEGRGAWAMGAQRRGGARCSCGPAGVLGLYVVGSTCGLGDGGLGWCIGASMT